MKTNIPELKTNLTTQFTYEESELTKLKEVPMTSSADVARAMSAIPGFNFLFEYG